MSPNGAKGYNGSLLDTVGQRQLIIKSIGCSARQCRQAWDSATRANDHVVTREDEEGGTLGEERLRTRRGSSHAFLFQESSGRRWQHT